MLKFFSYTKTKQEVKTNEKGEVIYKLDGEGNPIKTEPELLETHVTDWFNLNLIIRVWSIEKDHAIVLLNDGHEESQVIPVLKKDKKPNADSFQRQRKYIQTEIELKGEDVKRLHTVLTEL